MKQPLVMLAYEKLLPGSQLVHRLEDSGYRVKVVADVTGLPQAAFEEMPLLIIADLEPDTAKVCQAIQELQENQATAHVPVIALVQPERDKAETMARRAGAKLVVSDAVILAHLDQFMEQALEV